MSEETEVQQRYREVRARVDEACARVGRDPGEVHLLPVSKTKPVELVRELHAIGVTTFGENKVQEVVAKHEATPDLPDLCWSVIGHLQTNKARDVARVATELQTLDSVKLATALERRLQAEGRGLDVHLQVNSSGEESKFGLAPEDVPALARELTAFDSLRVVGLMTLAAPGPDTEVVAACFERVRRLQQVLGEDDRAAGSYDRLSMGMSGDYELAIAHGSTCVRVGTAIFGSRPPVNDYAHYWPEGRPGS
ncbi:YggS family pyridoxal phosphate-dependent enzyme [Auraticoccus monumenti]|uniref:YggS family pyridoxal phosphate-dependent enzyme n=1 Tax=Auraticoccus monumenti TaxID=675864 RepID=UPI0018D48922|nr:YggS family pyridoxal phosphate-dependent enzyme [Auraticoccus monumenti]